MNKLFCKYCNQSYVPSLSDQLEHLDSVKHKIQFEKNKSKAISHYLKGQEIIQAELIWSYLTVHRNLSLISVITRINIFPIYFQIVKLQMK